MTEYKISLKDGKVDWQGFQHKVRTASIGLQKKLLQALYNHALEEAAKVADHHFYITHMTPEAIRALKED